MSVGAVVCLLILMLLWPWRTARIRIANVYGKLIGPAIARILGFRPQIHNRDRIGAARPAIYITNHTSALDVFIGIWLCPMGGCGIAKKEIARIPFFGWAYLLSGHLLIDRTDREGAIAAFQRTADVVRRHRLSIWIWPEGTRSRDGRLIPFRKGFVHLAISTGLPVVPVILHRAHERLPSRSIRLHPGVLEVDVLEPIDTRNWKVETVEQHLDYVFDIVSKALGPSQQPIELPRD